MIKVISLVNTRLEGFFRISHLCTKIIFTYISPYIIFTIVVYACFPQQISLRFRETNYEIQIDLHFLYCTRQKGHLRVPEYKISFLHRL